MKNVIHVFGASGSGTTMARFCLSAFVRVATYSNDCTVYMGVLCLSAFVRVATLMALTCSGVLAFATAHSRGLRPRRSGSGLPSRIFATAHSRGLRRDLPIDSVICSNFATAHSRGLRRSNLRASSSSFPLPQRIRAGYDAEGKIAIADYVNLATAHSRGLRLSHLCLGIRTQKPCHSAFARVTTWAIHTTRKFVSILATAHSRGLRRRNGKHRTNGIPCHSAFARVTTAEKQCSALRICYEKVDSFSSVGESGLALTIFPFSFAAKATYVAINDSFGRAIDRFFWCEPHRN